MSQTERIHRYLATGKKLNPLQALRKFGCFRLGARIWDIKHEGHNIVAERVTRNGKNFCQYYLKKA